MKARYGLILAVAAAVCLPAAAQERQQGVALTVYNGGYGVVREVRGLSVPESGQVKFTDVAGRIDPTTVHFKSLTDADAKLLEQNYQYDLVSANKLLEKYIDREVQVVTEGGRYSGTLLSYDGAHLVLDSDDRGITMVRRADNVRDIRFGALPEGLLTRPTLVWLVATDKPGEHLTEVTYQTSGLGWHAEYVFVLDQADTKADLSGWVSVDNKSGKTYRDAKLKFIAGDVHRAPRPPAAPRYDRVRAGAMAGAAPMEEKAFFEYHMYTLPRPSTVADNEVKQLEMFPPARGVAVEKRYLYQPLARFRWNRGGRYTDRSMGVDSYKKVQVFVEFVNSEKNNLGIPLPAGKIRVYKRDPDDEAMEFVGEERIDHTPKDEELSLEVGNAFDVVGERRQVNFRIETRRNWMQETVEIKVRNHKEEDITVRVKEPMYRWNTWRMTGSSHDYEKLDAYNVAWDVPVEADGETVVTYTVEYTW
jgi:hypothetical protein